MELCGRTWNMANKSVWPARGHNSTRVGHCLSQNKSILAFVWLIDPSSISGIRYRPAREDLINGGDAVNRRWEAIESNEWMSCGDEFDWAIDYSRVGADGWGGNRLVFQPATLVGGGVNYQAQKTYPSTQDSTLDRRGGLLSPKNGGN